MMANIIIIILLLVIIGQLKSIDDHLEELVKSRNRAYRNFMSKVG